MIRHLSPCRVELSDGFLVMVGKKFGWGLRTIKWALNRKNSQRSSSYAIGQVGQCNLYPNVSRKVTVSSIYIQLTSLKSSFL